MSDYHNCFDVSIQCEEVYTVDPDEMQEIFNQIAAENEAKIGFSHWLDSLEPSEKAAYAEQAAFEQREARRKDYLNGYSNNQDGPTYGGIAI